MKKLLLLLVMLCVGFTFTGCQTMNKRLEPYVYKSAIINLRSQVMYAAHALDYKDTTCAGMLYVMDNYNYPNKYKKASKKERKEANTDIGFILDKAQVYDLYVKYLDNERK
ncbi:hypothetical protein [uncultured Bacteroides sp.]|uniref:hypothetical protein n=1 Tax=uncultured Bacteroides sp. TaxID=162156 RepID=UPI002AA8206D|nr:hypothetical protein [uncultured Bacteroides sp.]